MEGPYCWLCQPCQHRATPTASCCVPRHPDEEESCQTPHHLTPPAAEETCCGRGVWSFLCPCQVLLKRLGESWREVSRLRGHAGTGWSPGSACGPAFNPCEPQLLHVGILCGQSHCPRPHGGSTQSALQSSQLSASTGAP